MNHSFETTDVVLGFIFLWTMVNTQTVILGRHLGFDALHLWIGTEVAFIVLDSLIFALALTACLLIKYLKE